MGSMEFQIGEGSIKKKKYRTLVFDQTFETPPPPPYANFGPESDFFYTP